MKKTLQKVIAISLTVIAALMIILLLIVTLGLVSYEQLDNQIVKVLVVVLSIIFGVLAASLIATVFTDSDQLKSILLFKNDDSSSKATVAVVKKISRQALKNMMEIKIKRVIVTEDDNYQLHLRLNVYIYDNKVEKVTNAAKEEINKAFVSVMGLAFNSIDFAVLKIKATNLYSIENTETIEENKEVEEN